MKFLLQGVLSVAFCCALSSASDRGGYILTAPGKLQMGINESLCVQLTDFSEDVYVQLRLIDNVTVLSEIRHRFQNGKGGCIDFPVPDLGEREKSWEKDDLEIVGVGQTTDQRFEGKTQVNLVQRKAGIIFIQTDKPIYKPGQLVRIRLLAVDDNLRPVKNPISVLLRNPLQVKLANWADQQSDYGLFDLEFQLSAEPVMGTWAIEASYKGTKYPTSFTVEEYVLPKYEVTVTPPSYLNPWTPMIEGKVCAKYTYGKPVVGRLRVEVCLDKRGYYYRHSDDDSNRACTQYIADISGCQPFSVNASLLGMALNTYSVWSAKVTYNASVLEEATGVTLYGAAETTAIRNQEVNIKFEDVSQYYKPGLPFAGKVVVTRPDNSAAPGEPIRVTARNYGTGMHFEGNFTTDYDGSFRFSLPPEASKDSFNLQASALRYERGTYSVRENHHSVAESRAYHYVKPWYSPSNSFLEISPVSDMVRCGGAVPVEVTYTSYPGTEYNSHYQILSRGNIVSTGSVSNKGDESRYTPQQYSFDNFVRITTTPPPPTTTPIPTTTTASNTTNPPSPPPSPPAKPPSPPAPPPRSFDGAPDKRKKRDTEDMKGPNSTVTARFEFTIPMTTAMSSGGKLLVYFVRDDREVVADYTEFKAESCVDNKVEMAFKQSTVRPGEPSTLQVTATPGSLCGIGVVDKSVLLLGGDNQLSIEKVVQTLNERDPMRYFYGYLDYRETNRYCLDQIGIPEPYKDEVNETMLRLSYEWFYDMPFSYQLQQTDSLEAFMKVGFVTATNLDIMTRPCSTYQRQSRPVAFAGSQPDVARSSVSKDTVVAKGEEPQARTYFPETWLWDIEKVGENGVIELKREIPDTITEWVGRSVCTSAETGLGVSGSAKVTAFQSFFVSYTLPYSVIRGENIPVPVTIFNYLSECLAIEVSLDTASGEFLLDGEPVVTLCVCGQQSETHRYIITPSTIGSVNITVDARSVSDTGYCSNSLDMSEEGIGVRDIITQPLLVEPEGIPEEYTRSYFVCPSESVDKRFSQRIEMNTPDDVILDSARGYVTIIGDLMGPAMTNLDNLVRMPYGCGEQNMASFTPNIYVMQYLDSTNRLTPEIAEKAKNYMKIGYQRELRYRHPDGSYSSFGPNSWLKGEGSSWLTAFVVKSLAQARPYIYIDQEDLDRSIDFFKQTQNNETGCFRKVGQSSAYIKGGNEGQANSTLTAYILAALLEAHIEPEDDVVKNAVKCIENDDFTDIYTTALAAYALTLYDKGLPFRHKLLQTLKEKVIEEEGQQHWERADKPKREKRPSWWWYPAPSAEVEITAYALLAFIAEEQEGGVLIGQPIVQWLSRQRNAYGGFSSTQDTVVALHALAEYGAIAYSDGLDMTVTVADEADQDLITVHLTDSGSLIPRRQRIDGLPTEVTVSATGNGCALIQANARYNVQGETPKDPAFDVEVKLYQSVVEPKNCDRQRMQVCAKFQVTSQVSNMAIIEAKMVTGWEPEVDSLKALIQEPKWGIRRYEIEKDIVNFYFDEMTAQKSCVYFEIIKKLEVNNTKPGRVRVYDYYEAEYSVVTSYEIDPNCNSYRWEPIWWWRGGLVDDVLEAVPLAETEPEKTATLCPVCPSGTPDDVESLFCNSSVAYKVQAGRGGKYLFKILADLRPTKDKTRFNKVFSNATLAEECSCDVIYEDTKVVVFGPEGAYDPESQLVRLDGSTTVVKLTDQLEKTLTKTTKRPKCPKVE